MGNLTFVLGGARSGKSNYAEEIALKFQGSRLYIATAIPFDNDMKYRIQRHKNSRGKAFKTIETYQDFNLLKDNPIFLNSKVVILDCLTLLVNNQMIDYNLNWNNILPEKVNELEIQIKNSLISLLEISKNKEFIIVSNEVGLGIVPDNLFSIYFRDILGRLNQFIAEKANKVVFMLAGIPIIIKGDKK